LFVKTSSAFNGSRLVLKLLKLPQPELIKKCTKMTTTREKETECTLYHHASYLKCCHYEREREREERERREMHK
jgi:hypothetical protein